MLRKWLDPQPDYGAVGRMFLRSLGAIYFIAFLSLNRQVLALLGSDGLLPAHRYLDRLREHFGGSGAGFLEIPSLFWWNCSDVLLAGLSWVGLAISLLMVLGFASAIAMALLWFLYMSYVHIGQTFYGFGWETMTLEAGFLAIFLCPLRSCSPSRPVAVSPILFFWLRWMLFRVMFGAGLIKLRGDECWRDLTCLAYHYETQPIPNPLSWYFHQMPMWFHMAGCLFNHFVELVVPWFYFGPRRARIVAGLLTVLFQFILILSGNLSWLNWLTIVLAIPCFDDAFLRRASSAPHRFAVSPIRRFAMAALSLLLAALSLNPIANMLSPHQVMNTSFDRLHLMNTYGAFGSVGRVRNEIVIEGSADGTTWKAYEFLAKPGDPRRRPAFIAPYQSRIDWQAWFAAMQEPGQHPWLVHLIYKLLQGDARALSLLDTNPFPQAPPRFIRCAYYEYRFTNNRDDGARVSPKLGEGGWWTRTYLGLWLPPLGKDDPRVVEFLRRYGLADDP